jgi:CheY-like chemotaxis protein
LARSTSLSDYVAGERARAAEVPAPMHTIRVLLAEDHPTNQRVVQLILAGHPVELITVEDGAQAVAAFQAGRFDVILMDMQMPGMDGLTATRTIRELEATRAANIHTPIIMLSANAMAQHREQAIQAGADIHVPKPITAASLLAGIQAVLQT